MLRRLRLPLTVLLATAALAACGSDDDASASGDAWSYVSGDGKTYTADEVPDRIIAHAHAAAALLEYGIEPIAVYADGPVDEDAGLKNVDLEGIEVIGDTWGEIDVERAAELNPDLIVGDWWPADEAYSGLEEGVEKKSLELAKLAPVVGSSQGDSVVDLIEGYERLAASLGADVEDGPGAEARATFEASLERFRASVAAKPGLTVAAVSPSTDGYYVAVPDKAAELQDFQAWGLELVVPDTPDEFPYWETLSPENVDKYQADLLILDDRNYDSGIQVLQDLPTASSIKAWAAGAYTSWPAFWIHTWSDYAQQLDDLSDAIDGADPNIA